MHCFATGPCFSGSCLTLQRVYSDQTSKCRSNDATNSSASFGHSRGMAGNCAMLSAVEKSVPLLSAPRYQTTEVWELGYDNWMHRWNWKGIRKTSGIEGYVFIF